MRGSSPCCRGLSRFKLNIWGPYKTIRSITPAHEDSDLKIPLGTKIVLRQQCLFNKTNLWFRDLIPLNDYKEEVKLFLCSLCNQKMFLRNNPFITTIQTFNI